MAKVGGFLLKGLAGGLQWGSEMAWKKKQKKKLEEQQTKMIEAGTIFNTQLTEAVEDGVITDEEKNKISVTYFAGGFEFQEHYKDAMTHINSMHSEALKKEQKWMDDFIEMTSGYSPDDIPEMYDWGKKHFTSPKSKNFFEAYEATERKKAKPKPEVFPSLEAGRAKYPTAEFKWSADAGGYVAGVGEVKPPTPDKPPVLSAKDNWAIESYKEGRINFDELSKYMGTYIAPEEMSAKEKEIELMKEYGATNEEIKNKLIGVGAKGEPTSPTAPAIENVREDIKNADTVEDARRIHQNQIKKYGEEGLDIDDVDKFWAESQIPYLDNIKTTIGNIIDEKGWLKKGTLTSAEVGVDFKGEQKVEEIYKMLREEYIKYRDMLKKLGIDISQFPELKPLEEIEKVGFGEGFWGIGKQRGQYKSIYK